MMFSREQMNLARPGDNCFTHRSGFHYSNFQCLIVNNFKLYFCFNIPDSDTIFSINTPAKEGKSPSLTTFRISFSICPCSKIGINISSVQDMGAMKIWTRFSQVISVMQENDGNRCVRVKFSHHTSQRLHKLELFDRVLCWDWVVDSLGTGSAFTSSCKILSSVYWKMLPQQLRNHS